MLVAETALNQKRGESKVADQRILLPGDACELSYQVGGKTLINRVNLRLESGTITLIMGPNGAGKSLLLRLLHGMLLPTGGTVHWGGQSLTKAVRKHQAMVFQRPVLLRRSVAANVRFALKLRHVNSRRSIAELLEEVGLEAQAKQPARSLSEGEQQRLSLARALAIDPQVLFLDEPTANLDPAATAAIEETVRHAHQRGTKIVFVTHDIGQARRLANDVVFMQHGSMAEHTQAAKFFNQAQTQAARDFLAGRLLLDNNKTLPPRS